MKITTLHENKINKTIYKTIFIKTVPIILVKLTDKILRVIPRISYFTLKPWHATQIHVNVVSVSIYPVKNEIFHAT